MVLYRRPALAGIFIGLATSVVYYPLFLLPLWISFYWQRGFARFVMGVIGSVTQAFCGTCTRARLSADNSIIMTARQAWRDIGTAEAAREVARLDLETGK